MSVYKGLSGNQYTVPDKPFAGGGEGDIYDVVGTPGYVAKVYKPDKRTTDREHKLSVMVSNKPSVMEQYAWPLDVIYENGQFIGYIMPKINGKEKLRNIYVYDKRKGKTWSLFIAIAKNLSAAVHNVHEIHQVVGDLNPENILVNPNDGMVTLVDTDSYHISDSSRTYRCGVGMPEFVAPELQGVHFPSAPLPTFTRESDLFALAVLIFALLMNGAHPFACKVISGSSSKFAPIDNMKNGICSFFADSRANNMDIPRYAPDINSLPQNVQELFRRAFISGHGNPALRPSAEEWYNALEQLEDNLKTCLVDSQHIYYYGASECPWCKVVEKMHSISQTAFNSSSQSGSNSSVGVQSTSPTGQAPQFSPSNYRYVPSSSSSVTQNYSGNMKDKTTSILLCIFLGWLGVHKYYEGKIGKGILYSFTLGLFGIGVIIDLILLIAQPSQGGMYDANNIKVPTGAKVAIGISSVVIFMYGVSLISIFGLIASSSSRSSSKSNNDGYSNSSGFSNSTDFSDNEWNADDGRTTIESGMEVEKNNSYSSANEILLDNIYSGMLSSPFSSGEQDWYKFTLSENKTVCMNFYTKEQSSSDAYWDISIRSGINPEKDIWQKYVNGDVTETISSKLSLEAGNYYVEIESSSCHSKDSYEFMIENVVEFYPENLDLLYLNTYNVNSNNGTLDLLINSDNTVGKSGRVYTNGLNLSLQRSGESESHIDVDYSVPEGYTTLSGVLDVLEYSKNLSSFDCSFIIEIDGVELYRNTIDGYSDIIDFNITCDKISKIKFKIRDNEKFKGDTAYVLADLTLSGKESSDEIDAIELGKVASKSNAVNNGTYFYHTTNKTIFEDTYNNCIISVCSTSADGMANCDLETEYMLNGKYKQFKSKLICYNENNMESGSYVEIYGDEELIYRSPRMVKNEKIYDIVADVNNVSVMKVVFKNTKGLYNNSYRTFALIDPLLSTDDCVVESKNTVSLSDMAFVNDSLTNGSYYFSCSNKTIYDKTYNNCVVAVCFTPADSNGSFDTEIEYELKGKYKQLKSKLICYNENNMESGSYVEIYGDEELIYKSPRMVKNEKIYDIVADVNNVSVMKVVFKNTKGLYNNSYRTFALIDPLLSTDDCVVESKNTVSLSDMAFENDSLTNGSYYFSCSNKTIYDKTYNNCVVAVCFTPADSTGSYDTEIEYELNGKYKEFKSKLICYNENNMESGSYVEIYGDGKRIYKSSELVKRNEIIDVNIDVSNISKMKIVFRNYKGRYNNSYRAFALLDPVLSNI